MSSDREEGEVYSDDDCKIIDISTDSVEQVPASAAAAVPPSKPLEVTLSARQSEDMDISPTASDKLPENDEHAGYVVEVDSPLDSTIQSPAVPEPVNRPETPPPPAPPPTISLKKRKRFSQRFLSQLRSFLLNGLDDFTSSSESDSETEDVYQQLRDQLDFHHQEHQDALKKKAKLIKDLEACELVINHHNECIGNLLSEISMKSNDLVRHFKSKNRRNKRRAFNIQHDFETKIEDMLYQMNTMTQLLPENEPVTEIAWNEKPQNFPISLGASIGVETSSVKKRMVDKTVDTVDLPKQSATTQINSGQKRKRKTNNLLSKEEELRQKLVLKKSKNLVTTPEANENIKNSTRMKIVEVSTNSPSDLVHSTSSAPVSPIKVVNPSFTTNAVRPAYSAKSKEDVTEKENSKLFEGPLMYFRSFILDPMYPIKQSLEQLRTRINPEVPMCYYELFGFCIDQTCPDQHQRDSRLSDQQLLEEILSFVPGRSKENLEKQATSLLKEKTIEKIIEDLRREVSGQSFIELAVSRVEFVKESGLFKFNL